MVLDLETRRARFDALLATARWVTVTDEEVQAAKAEELRQKSTKGKKDNKDEKSLLETVAELILKEDHFAQDAGGKVYRFAGGVYKSRGEEFIRRKVKYHCEVLGAIGGWSKRFANEIVEFIRVDAPELWERPPLDVVNVKNGLLRLSDRKLLPHSHKHLSPVQLPVTFNPNATCPAIDKFVSEVFPLDATALAYEIPAILMLPDTALQKAVLLLGAGGNGKSVWLTLLVNFLGSVNVSALSLHKLESDRFAAARLIGKLANVCADLPTEHLSGTSIFKSITGGDPITAEYKFRDSFDFTPFARLVFSANSPPRSQDGSEGFFERWLVIPFDGKFRGTRQEIPKPDLDAMLSAPGELSGLLNRALDAREAIVKRSGRLHSCESVEAAHREFHATTDPLGVWLDRFTIDDPQACAPKRVLRAAYGAACEQAGRPPLSEKQFTQTLVRHRPCITDGQRTLNGRREHCFIGIGLCTADDHVAQDAQDTPHLFPPTNRVPARESEDDSEEQGESETSKAHPVQGVQAVQCDRCGSGEFKDVPIHKGRSIRRDCAKCGKTLGFSEWSPSV